MCQKQAACEQRKLICRAGQRVAVAVSLSLMEKPVLDKRHTVESRDTLIVARFRIDWDTLQKGI